LIRHNASAGVRPIGAAAALESVKHSLSLSGRSSREKSEQGEIEGKSAEKQHASGHGKASTGNVGN
jgi:hypothetical protein